MAKTIETPVQNITTTKAGNERIKSVTVGSRSYLNNKTGKDSLLAHLCSLGCEVSEGIIMRDKAFKLVTEKSLANDAKKDNRAILSDVASRKAIATTLNGMVNSKDDKLSQKKQRVYDLFTRRGMTGMSNKEMIREAKKMCAELGLNVTYIDQL